MITVLANADFEIIPIPQNLLCTDVGAPGPNGTLSLADINFLISELGAAGFSTGCLSV